MEPLNTKDIKEKFQEVYEREVDCLFRYCATRVSNREQARDIVQDVFIELWQMYQKGEEIKNNRAFLFAVLRNRIIDWYRKKKSLSLDAMMEKSREEGEYSFEPADSKAHENIIFSSEVKRLMEAIKTLAPNYQEVVYLRLVEDLSPQQIAQTLGCTPNVISVRITRGLEKLRKNFNLGGII